MGVVPAVSSGTFLMKEAGKVSQRRHADTAVLAVPCAFPPKHPRGLVFPCGCGFPAVLGALGGAPWGCRAWDTVPFLWSTLRTAASAELFLDIAGKK